MIVIFHYENDVKFYRNELRKIARGVFTGIVMYRLQIVNFETLQIYYLSCQVLISDILFLRDNWKGVIDELKMTKQDEEVIDEIHRIELIDLMSTKMAKRYGMLVFLLNPIPITLFLIIFFMYICMCAITMFWNGSYF